jgi:hypothetical protein
LLEKDSDGWDIKVRVNPWRLLVLLPAIVLVEALHILCEVARRFDDNILQEVGEIIEDWCHR